MPAATDDPLYQVLEVRRRDPQPGLSNHSWQVWLVSHYSSFTIDEWCKSTGDISVERCAAMATELEAREYIAARIRGAFVEMDDPTELEPATTSKSQPIIHAAFELTTSQRPREPSRPQRSSESTHNGPGHDDEKECPYCAELIKHKAIVCRHCGRDITTSGHAGSIISEPSTSIKVPCKKCGANILETTARKTGGYCARHAEQGRDVVRGKKTSKLHKQAGNVQCPSCGQINAHKISAPNKVGSAAAFGLFSVGHLSKTFKCDSCGYKW